ncbi:MAG: response regulator [Halieaceae bacterium]
MEQVPGSGGGEIIMVVDDDAAIVYMLEMMLDGLGYVVEAFSSSVDAATAFASDPDRYDLLLTDLAMPGMSGAELAERVQGIRPQLPVVVLTGFAGDSFSAEAGEHLNVKRVLIKPVSMDVLAVEIKAVLGAA